MSSKLDSRIDGMWLDFCDATGHLPDDKAAKFFFSLGACAAAKHLALFASNNGLVTPEVKTIAGEMAQVVRDSRSVHDEFFGEDA